MKKQHHNPSSFSNFLSPLKLRIFAGVSFMVSLVLGFFSVRRELDYSVILTRMIIPERMRYMYKIVWETAILSVIFLITAVALFVFSLRKSRKL